MKGKLLIVIVGPTASGKSSLAMKIAEEFDGEIIAADSRTIYKGMDIGTAKPTKEDRVNVPHWGLDIVEPGERFTVRDYQKYAVEAINDIRSRDKLPIMVGGTGLYIFSVIYDYVFPNYRIDPDKRKDLEKMTVDQLKEYCIDHNIDLPKNEKNKRHLISAIERNGYTLSRKDEPIDNCIVVGISTKKEELGERIAKRSIEMFDSGVIQEARELASKYGWDSEAMTGNIYPIMCRLINGDINKPEAIELFRKSDIYLAKRQLTWLKRSEHITWLDLDEAYTYLARILADLNKS